MLKEGGYYCEKEEEERVEGQYYAEMDGWLLLWMGWGGAHHDTVVLVIHYIANYFMEPCQVALYFCLKSRPPACGFPLMDAVVGWRPQGS